LRAAREVGNLIEQSSRQSVRTRNGIMRALNRHVERVFNPDRKDHRWGKRKLARDR
jgi:hypothetical protein